MSAEPLAAELASDELASDEVMSADDSDVMASDEVASDDVMASDDAASLVAAEVVAAAELVAAAVVVLELSLLDPHAVSTRPAAAIAATTRRVPVLPKRTMNSSLFLTPAGGGQGDRRNRRVDIGRTLQRAVTRGEMLRGSVT
jgi:hypothetical protein